MSKVVVTDKVMDALIKQFMAKGWLYRGWETDNGAQIRREVKSFAHTVLKTAALDATEESA